MELDKFQMDSEEEEEEEEEEFINKKIYTPKELNNLLLLNTSQIANNFGNIIMIGDIVECKIWKSSGMSFKIMNNRDFFECKVWIRDGCDLNKVKQHESMNCKIIGYIKAEYYYGHKFVLNVTDIELETTDTKLKRFKKECTEKGYFKNKKSILWENIKNIGIISKTNTQGYNDFIKQFKIPLSIITEEIPLEGPNTSKQCISAIKKLQNVDIIIIIRGGGSTSEMSNSFDKIELFSEMHKSKIPIITAIGHEADKGDKLLITEISDRNFPTPSTASSEITKILLNPIFEKMGEELYKINIIINDIIIEKYDELYDILKCLFNKYTNDKFGGPIIKITDEKFIIIEKDSILYKTEINFDNKMDFTLEEVNKYNEINNSINNNEIKKINNYFNDIIESNAQIKNIKQQTKKIKKINKQEHEFKNIKSQKIDDLYCKPYNLDNLDNLKLDELIKLYSMILWYNEVLKQNDIDNITEVYKYYKI